MNELESDPKVAAFIRYSAPLLGVILLLGAVGLVSHAARLLVSPGYRAPLDNPMGGVVLLIAAAGVVVLSWRLVSGRRRGDGGILPPWLIALGSLLFFVAPIVVFRVTGNIHMTFVSALVWPAVAASGIKVLRDRRRR